jgi:anti-anti-sigma factor
VAQIERTQIEPDIVVLQISGRLTLGRECQYVEWAIDELVRDGRKKVVFDLSGLTYIDSAGVGIIVMCCGKMQAAGGELRLADLQPKVVEVMKVTKLDRIYTFYPTAAGAAENFDISL